MTTPSPVNSITAARRRYASARTLLWNAHDALAKANIDQGHRLALEQALIDNQESIDYLGDLIRNVRNAAEAVAHRQARSASHQEP